MVDILVVVVYGGTALTNILLQVRVEPGSLTFLAKGVRNIMLTDSARGFDPNHPRPNLTNNNGATKY